MKFKIELDVEDFLEDVMQDNIDGYATSIKAGLVDGIKREVISQINAQKKEQVKKEITEKVLNEVNGTVSLRISMYIDEIIQKGILHEGTTNAITIKELIERNFTNTRYWDNLLPSIRKVGEEFGAIIKKRYDLAFASTILNNLKENNMLNNNAVKALFNDSSD
jgi:hypothetical protein